MVSPSELRQQFLTSFSVVEGLLKNKPSCRRGESTSQGRARVNCTGAVVIQEINICLCSALEVNYKWQPLSKQVLSWPWMTSIVNQIWRSIRSTLKKSRPTARNRGHLFPSHSYLVILFCFFQSQGWPLHLFLRCFLQILNVTYEWLSCGMYNTWSLLTIITHSISISLSIYKCIIFVERKRK